MTLTFIERLPRNHRLWAVVLRGGEAFFLLFKTNTRDPSHYGRRRVFVFLRVCVVFPVRFYAWEKTGQQGS